VNPAPSRGGSGQVLPVIRGCSGSGTDARIRCATPRPRRPVRSVGGSRRGICRPTGRFRTKPRLHRWSVVLIGARGGAAGASTVSRSAPQCVRHLLVVAVWAVREDSWRGEGSCW